MLAYRQHYIPHRDSFESVIVYAMTTRYNYGGGFMHSYTLPSYLEQRIIMILHWQHLIIENIKKNCNNVVVCITQCFSCH